MAHPLLSKRDSDPGGIKKVVGFTARRRMIQITVAQRYIPGEPLCDLGGQTGIEIHAELAPIGHVIEHPEALDERSGAVDLYRIVVAIVPFRGLLYQRRAEARMVEIHAAQKVQVTPLSLDGVKSETTAEHESQVQILKFVIFIVVENVRKHARMEIVVVTDSASHGLRRIRVLAVGQRRGLDRVEVKRSLVQYW